MIIDQMNECMGELVGMGKGLLVAGLGRGCLTGSGFLIPLVHMQGYPGAKRILSSQVVKMTTLHTWAVLHPWENIRAWIKGLQGERKESLYRSGGGSWGGLKDPATCRSLCSQYHNFLVYSFKKIPFWGGYILLPFDIFEIKDQKMSALLCVLWG